MYELDVKVLTMFAATYKTSSVSQAADNLGLSQSTISFNIAKLREHFKDPLFVRTSRGMEATPFAKDLHEQVVEVLASFRAMNKLQSIFNPASDARTFRIAMTDISQLVMLPSLLNRMRIVAPRMRLQVAHISSETTQMLERGDLDLAVGFMPQLNAGFHQQTFFNQKYVVLARAGHQASTDMTMKAYLAAEHIAVTTPGQGSSFLDRLLNESQLSRNVLLDVPNHLGVAELVAQTGLLVTVSERLVDVVSPDLPIVRFPAPFDATGFDVKQHWHIRNHHDPAHRWMRQLLAELFLDDTNDWDSGRFVPATHVKREDIARLTA